MTRDSRKYLPPEAISRISRLEVLARNVVEGYLSGLHRSPYFGQSVEFVQHREYVKGDDPRKIDWKAWSKTDKYYVKQYEEDTNLRTTLLVDVSESMHFASGPLSKYEFACGITACLTYLLLRQQDSVGMYVFSEGVKAIVPHRSKRNHILSVLQELDKGTPKAKTDMGQILSQVAEEQSQRGMVIVISDLFVPREGLFRGLNMLRHRGHDVLLFHVMDDAELDFEYTGSTRFEGLEEAGELLCDPRALRDGYVEALHAYLDELRRFCAGAVIDYQTIRTSEHLDAILSRYLNHRLGLRQSVRA